MSDVKTMLEQKFGRVNVVGKFYYFACPTCTARHRNKRKRYLAIGALTSNCWICGIHKTVAELFDGQYVDVKPDAVTLSMLRTPPVDAIPADPYTSLVPIHHLPDQHPAKLFLMKDHLFEFERYYRDYGIAFIPVEGGKTLRPQNPFISSVERLYFPAFHKGKKVGYQLRSLPGTTYGDRQDCIRYYHCFRKGNYLYNHDRAAQHPFVIVVEGVKKALKFNNAVATWGKGISFTQKQLMLGWNNIVIMLDAGDETQKLAKSLELEFRTLGRLCINIDPGKYGYPSPDEAKKENLHEIVCKEWSDYTRAREPAVQQSSSGSTQILCLHQT